MHDRLHKPEASKRSRLLEPSLFDDSVDVDAILIEQLSNMRSCLVVRMDIVPMRSDVDEVWWRDGHRHASMSNRQGS